MIYKQYALLNSLTVLKDHSYRKGRSWNSKFTNSSKFLQYIQLFSKSFDIFNFSDSKPLLEVPKVSHWYSRKIEMKYVMYSFVIIKSWNRKKCIFLSLFYPFSFNGFFYFTKSKMIQILYCPDYKWLFIPQLDFLTTSLSVSYSYMHAHVHEKYVYNIFHIFELIFIYDSFHPNLFDHFGYIQNNHYIQKQTYHSRI